MKPEDVKIGEMYKAELLCIHNVGTVIVFETPSGDHLPFRECDIECLTPENGSKNYEPAPKHDPCRRFRKGDKVRVVAYKGRNKTGVQSGEIGSIDKDEKDADVAVEVIFYGDDLWEVDPAYLELVTPFEEQEPFTCGESIDGCILYKNGDYYAEFLNSEDAQRACKLLNAEHRKEQK